MTLRSTDLHSIEAEIDRLTLAPQRETSASGGEELHFTNVVVAMDGSEGAQHALEWAAWFGTQEEARVHLVSALGPPPYSYDSGEAPPIHGSVASWRQLMAEEREDAEGVVEAARRQLSEQGVDATTELAIGSPASVVSAVAESRGADLVICGSHDAGAIERLLLGSVADGIKHQAHCSVLIAKGPAAPRPVLLPTDGSPMSRTAVLTGVSLAERLKTDGHILHVVRGRSELSERGYREAVEAAEKEGTIRAAPADLPRHIRSEVAFGDPDRVIVEQAERMGASLVVMGSRGLGGLAGRMLGSVSNRVSHEVSCSILYTKSAA